MMPITGRDDEFKATITYYYGVELGREPDPGGMASWLEQLQNGMTGPELQKALNDSPEGVAYDARPPVPDTPSLRIQGRNFINADGDRIVACGCDQFMALRMALDGVSLAPLVDESIMLGFDLWRVFLQGSKAQNGLLQLSPTEPGYYAMLGDLAVMLNNNGIVLLATAYVDNQDIKSGPEHWQRSADALRGTESLLSGGNEWSKNGFDPATLTDPGMPWSRGSDIGDAAPFRPYGSFAEFHPRRDLPKSLLDTVASPVEIYTTDGLTAPLIIDEPPRMGVDGSAPAYADPFVCWQFARNYATMCAGAVFHNRCGQRGILMDDVTKKCAIMWVKGMTL